MNVLVASALFPPDIGGPATYVPRIASALSERGHSVTVLAVCEENTSSKDYPFRLVLIRRGVGRLRRWLAIICQILLLGQNADVLFVNGLAVEVAVANLLLRKPSVQKIVGDLAWERATLWGWSDDSFDEFQRRRHSWRVQLLKAVRTWSTRRSGRVIVPSQFLGERVVGWGIATSKLDVIYNAVELPKVISPVDLPLTSRTKGVTVGRLVSWKGIGGIIAAVAELDDVGLVVVGDGPERVVLEQLVAKLGVTERVFFAGQRTHAETMGIVAGSDVFVLNSTYEGLPHVIVEALALGIPVVSSAVGGTPEVVEHGRNGLLFPVGDAVGLSASLSTLARDLALRRRLSEGARGSPDRFGIAHMIEETEGVLKITSGGAGDPTVRRPRP